MKLPHTHKQAERRLVELVKLGEWEIDDDGRVWRLAARRGDRWGRGSVRAIPCERRRAEKRLPSGYLMVRAMFEGKRVVGQAHRLVWQWLHGDIDDGMVVNHLNGIKYDNRPANLEVVTPSENARHAYRVGLSDEHGERNPAAKLSDDEVVTIRAAYAAGGITQAQLAERFGVRHQSISRIIRGDRRPRQPGPVSQADHRRATETRDDSGRFASEVRP